MIPSAVETAQRGKAGARPAEKASKYLAFRLGAEEFGVEVMKIREIIGLQEVTAVPHTPDYVRGVINLRGKVIPVLDLRRKLGLPSAEETQCTCIVVVQSEYNGGKLLTGVVVDGVSEVLTVMPGEIESAPDFGRDSLVHHVLGIAKVKGKVKILLDIDQILDTGETAAVSESAEGLLN